MGFRCRLGIHRFVVVRTYPLIVTNIGLITGMRPEERQAIGRLFSCKGCGKERAEIVDLDGTRRKTDPAFFVSMKGRQSMEDSD